MSARMQPCDRTGCKATAEWGREGIGLALCDRHLDEYRKAPPGQPLTRNGKPVVLRLR